MFIKWYVDQKNSNKFPSTIIQLKKQNSTIPFEVPVDPPHLHPILSLNLVFTIPLLFFSFTTYLYPGNIHYLVFLINGFYTNGYCKHSNFGSVLCVWKLFVLYVATTHAFSLLYRIPSRNIPQLYPFYCWWHLFVSNC